MVAGTLRRYYAALTARRAVPTRALRAKLQIPSSKHQISTKLQTPTTLLYRRVRFERRRLELGAYRYVNLSKRRLELGASLDLGSWCLVLRLSHRPHRAARSLQRSGRCLALRP